METATANLWHSSATRYIYRARRRRNHSTLLAYDILAVVSRKIWPFETISQMDVKNMAEHIMAFFNVRLNEIKKDDWNTC